MGFVGRCKIGLTDNFNQRYAGTVQVDGGLFLVPGKSFVQALACVLFQMHARDANALAAAEFDPALGRERFVVLRYLISLGKVGIEIILAREDRCFMNPAV